MLADVLHTPLLPQGEGGWTLAQVPSTRRLNELEFTVPAPDLQAGALQAQLQRHGLDGPRLHFVPLHGHLRGFIDLVFEHAGRFHVLDWKSNHLGPRPQDYAPPALAQAMAAQGYHLQLLLYTLALHRLLQQRLPGYDYDAHVGPGLYLFVRGVRPGWRSEDGRPCGVHAWRPSLALVEALGTLLGPAEQAPGGPSLDELLAGLAAAGSESSA
jgi:exodeoxyribonuclease V beta subunit